MRVEKIMREDVLGLGVDESMHVAWRRMRDQRIDVLHVTDPAGHLVGQLTEEDLLARLAPRRSPRWWATMWGATDQLAADYVKAVGLTVGDIMTMTPLVTIAPDATIQDAAALMRQHDVRTLPVVSADVCIGIVTRADVLDHLAWPTAPLPGAIGDADLQRTMRESIEREVWASGHPVTVEALNGIIKLTGVVSSPVERSGLLAMARSLAGAAGVDDRLIVRRTRRHRAAPVI